MGHGQTLKSNPKDMQMAIYGHSTMVHGKTMYRFGGNIGTSVTSTACTLNELTDPGQAILLVQYLKQMRQEDFMCDVTFRVKDTDLDKIVEIKAHRAIVAARCEFLKNAIQKQIDEAAIKDDSSSYYVPDMDKPAMVFLDILDFNAAVLEAFINYCYSGDVVLEGTENIAKLVELANLWSPSVQGMLVAGMNINI